MQRIRTFIAIKVDEDIVDSVTAVTERLRHELPGIRWVAPDNLHVTLAFLGDVEARDIPLLCDAVNEVASRYACVDLLALGLGAFPSPTRPRTIWVGFTEGAATVIKCQADLADAIESFGYRREVRPFVPHLTIGRAKRPVRVSPKLARKFDELSTWSPGRCCVDQILVMASQLSRSGPEYSILAHCPLRNGAAPGERTFEPG